MTVLLACDTKLAIAVSLIVILIVSPVSGTVIVPFPSNATMLCVRFIGVMLVVHTRSSHTGLADNSNPEDGGDDDGLVATVFVVVVVVVLLLAVVVEAAAAGATDAVIIIDNANRVAATIDVATIK